jgi:cytochrome b6-f complex iron-sulfur subunit
MAEEKTLGRLPKWPRKALNNSVIAAEQAYRKRSSLPLLSDADVEALKAGTRLPWENEDGTLAALASAASGNAGATAAASAPVAVATPTATAVANGGFSPEVEKWLAAGKKWSKSAIAAEQARRKRNNLSPLTEAEVTALLGEPAGAAAPAPAAAATPAAAPAARPAAAATAKPALPNVPQVARTGTATRYVGTPAVGTSKAAAAGGVAGVGPEDTPIDQRRRRLVWSAVGAFLGAWLLAFFRFFLPRTLFEPNTVFKIGYPTDYALGVDTKFQQRFRIWVDRTPDRLFVIYARCTHLGCTPDWKPSENKFKCPCHGSGYDSEGINFEGPAPRPMDRAHVELAADGQIQVDVSKLYSWPKGQPSHFDDDGSFLKV